MGAKREFSRKSGYHRPNALAHGYKTKLKKAVKYVEEDNLKVDKAVSMAFGIRPRQWRRWEEMVVEDVNKGYSGTELMDVYFTLMEADGRCESKFTRKAGNLALEEDNVDMIKFILERRFGYKKQTQKEVEVATKDDLNFNINIVDSKKKEDE